jgi:segregation and condensation protein A
MIDQTDQSIREDFSYSDEVIGQNGHDQPIHYVVHLPVFEGPLDLLLHLIEKRQMEITTISLVAVTDQYLAYLQQWQEPDSMPLANMAAFISIAARLLYIKSQSLLPHTSKEEMTGELENAAAMADELRTHLLEYKLAKEIASYLRLREEEGLQTFARSGLLAGIEAQLAWSPPTLLGLEIDTLTIAFQRLLELHVRDEANNGAFIPLARVRVSERIAEIVGLLRVRASVHLSELLENERSRLVIIVTFLAVLELWKRERICVKQTTLFNPILLERGERWTETEQVNEEELEYGA